MMLDEDALRRAAKDLVHKATEENTLEKVGKKAVLRYLRECGEFAPEVLEDENFKERAVAIAAPLLQAALDQQEEDVDPDIVRKSRAKKRKSQPDDSDQETEEARPTKKARPSASKKQKEKAEEEDVPIPGSEDAKPPQKTTSEPKSMSTADNKKKEPASPPKTPVNKKKPGKPHKKKPDSDEESEDGKRASTPPVLKNGSRTQDKSAESAPNGEETLAEAAELSDGDLSVLDPDSPKKEKAMSPRKKSVSSKASKPKKERKVSSSKGKENGPDDEEIKRLKSYVVACGVRKQWKKEFEGIEDKPKKQIVRLKEILNGLGMTGRLSLDKAKAIRHKRDLATELEEVVAFEAKRGARTEEKTDKRSRKATTPEEEPHLSEEEQEAVQSQPRKKNILAFLADQSDDEE